MSFLVRAPREVVARKPPHGSACNRCGLCCMITLCPLAQHVFKQEMGPCPALTLEAGSTPPAYTCGLTIAPGIPAEMREAAKLLVRAGQGCDSRINGEAFNTAFDQRLDRQDERDASRIAEARRLWDWRAP